MKSETRVVFVARDGAEFRTEALCRAHERKTSGALLVGLSARQVEAARTGANPQLAEAFLMFAAELRKLKRPRSNGPTKAVENNAGDKTAPPLSGDPGSDSAADSEKRTDPERAGVG